MKQLRKCLPFEKVSPSVQLVIHGSYSRRVKTRQKETNGNWVIISTEKAPPRSGPFLRCFWLYLALKIYENNHKSDEEYLISSFPKLSPYFGYTSVTHQLFTTMKKRHTLGTAENQRRKARMRQHFQNLTQEN